MTPEQRLRLAAVSERLAEVVIRDVDPDNWHHPGTVLEGRTGATLGNMTRDERGDAVWCRKAAAQSIALLVRVEQLLGTVDGPPAPGELDPEKEIKRAELAAQVALERCAVRA